MDEPEERPRGRGGTRIAVGGEQLVASRPAAAAASTSGAAFFFLDRFLYAICSAIEGGRVRRVTKRGGKREEKGLEVGKTRRKRKRGLQSNRD